MVLRRRRRTGHQFRDAVGVLGRERPGDRGEQHVAGGECAQIISVGRRRAECRDDDGELAARDQRGACPNPAGNAGAQRSSRHPTRHQLSGDAEHRQYGGRRQHVAEVARVDREREEQEERGGEEIAQRADHGGGAGLDRAREGETDEKRTDRGRHLHLLRQPADEKREPEDGEQQRLVRRRGERLAEMIAPAQGDGEDHCDCGERHGDGDRQCRRRRFPRPTPRQPAGRRPSPGPR